MRQLIKGYKRYSTTRIVVVILVDLTAPPFPFLSPNWTTSTTQQQPLYQLFRFTVWFPEVRMKTPALLSVALLLVVSVVTTTRSNQTPITIRVTNAVTNSPNKTYSTHVAFRGILIGALRRLQESSQRFTFTYTEHADYGPFLESVNGLAGNFSERTYWELLVKRTNNSIIRPDVGIGCYIPNANEQIILKYNTY